MIFMTRMSIRTGRLPRLHAQAEGRTLLLFRLIRNEVMAQPIHPPTKKRTIMTAMCSGSR